MDQAIPAAEANRGFSRLLREVRDGHSFVVTAHDKPVARIVPCDELGVRRETAKSVLLQRLDGQDAVDSGGWTRDELYER